MILQDSVIYHTRAHGDRPPARLLDDVSHIVLSSHARNAIADACLERRPTEICPLGKAQVWVKFFRRLHYLSRDAINYRGGVHIHHLAGSIQQTIKYRLLESTQNLSSPYRNYFWLNPGHLFWTRNILLENSVWSNQ